MIRQDLKRRQKTQDKARSEAEELRETVARVMRKAGVRNLASLRANMRTVLKQVALASAKRQMPGIIRLARESAKTQGKIMEAVE